MWSPHATVIALCLCHQMSGLFAQRVTGGDTELGGPGGHDAGASSSQEVEDEYPKLDSGSILRFLLTGGGQVD